MPSPTLLWMSITLWDKSEVEFVKLVTLPSPLVPGVAVSIIPGLDPDVPHWLFWSYGANPVLVANFRETADTQDQLEWMTEGWVQNGSLDIDNFRKAYEWSLEA